MNFSEAGKKWKIYFFYSGKKWKILKVEKNGKWKKVENYLIYL